MTNDYLEFSILLTTTLFNVIHDLPDPMVGGPKIKRLALIGCSTRIQHKAMCTKPQLGVC